MIHILNESGEVIQEGGIFIKTTGFFTKTSWERAKQNSEKIAQLIEEGKIIEDISNIEIYRKDKDSIEKIVESIDKMVEKLNTPKNLNDTSENDYESISIIAEEIIEKRDSITTNNKILLQKLKDIDTKILDLQIKEKINNGENKGIIETSDSENIGEDIAETAEVEKTTKKSKTK